MGSKYIIELEDEPFTLNGEELWRIKGFNSLVFDQHGLNKLKPYDENKTVSLKVHMDKMQELEDDIWDLARDIFVYWNEEDKTGEFPITSLYNIDPVSAAHEFKKWQKDTVEDGWYTIDDCLPLGDDGSVCEQVVVITTEHIKATGWRNGLKKEKPWFLIVGSDDYISRHDDDEILCWRPLP